MRVFIAIDLPEEIRGRLSVVQMELRPAAPSARWVDLKSAHLTLRFLGEIPDKRTADIDCALAGLNREPFAVVVRGVGFFPGARSPRVLWAGIEPSPMERLAEEINARLERSGFEKEDREFRAHITLARANNTRLGGALAGAAAKFEDEHFGSFTVDRCFLYRSTLKPTGSVYTRLREYPLSGIKEA